MTKPDGGPAFPVIPPVDETGRSAVGYPYADLGMSLRDWFAGQALRARWGDGTAMTEEQAARMPALCSTTSQH